MSLGSPKAPLLPKPRAETPRNRPTARRHRPSQQSAPPGRRQRRHPPVPNSRNLRRRWLDVLTSPRTRVSIWGGTAESERIAHENPQLHRMAASPGGYICTEAELAPFLRQKESPGALILSRFWLKWWDNTNFLSRKLRKKRQQASWGAESRKADRGPLSLTTSFSATISLVLDPSRGAACCCGPRAFLCRSMRLGLSLWRRSCLWPGFRLRLAGAACLSSPRGLVATSFCRWSPLQSSQVIHSQLNTQPVTQNLQRLRIHRHAHVNARVCRLTITSAVPI